jgi:transposase
VSLRRPTHGSAVARAHHSRGKVGVTRLEVTLEGLYQAIDRVKRQQLEPGDWPLIHALLVNEAARSEGRQDRAIARIDASKAAEGAGETGLTIAALSHDGAAARISTSPDSGKTHGEESRSTARGDAGLGWGDSKERESPKSKGHGRNGARAFHRAQHHLHALEHGVIGAVCEKCRRAKMNRYPEKTIVRIIGQPMFGAEVHHHEQARCRNCGRIVRASGPEELTQGLGTDYVRYDWSACAMLMVMHYFGGAPFKRIESLHEGWGVPMPDANQWTVVSDADDLLLPLYRAMEQHAIAKSTNFRIDDTGGMVITLKQQIDAEIAALRALGKSTKDVRTGINATGLYWETPDGPIILFYTGLHHAGEIVDRLLRHRLLSSPKLVKCTDGASKNFDHEHADKLVESTCNAHALLKFRDLKDKHPVEYAEAGRVYKKVFDHDDEAKALGLSPIERMLYHRERSKPLMLELKKMCEEKIRAKLVEPNSRLWEPLTFVINQWDRLTRFYEVPGVPLDTNLVEQALIMPVRYLAGSFNYHTEDGAVVGDHAMSLIASARANGVEPVAYLTECLRCHENLAKDPDQYLPWVYRERCKDVDASNASSRAPPRETPRREPEPLRSAQPTSVRSAQGLRHLAPELRKGAARRVAAPDQHL